MAESALYGDLQMEAGKHGGVLYRNNQGLLKALNKDGSVRYVKYGVGDGGSDLIGILSVVVTPEMVGQTVGLFLAVEVKVRTKSGGRTRTTNPTDDQARFLELVRKRGGVALVARSVEDLRVALAQTVTPP